jgi:16S rRNA (guanine527-N7)-methyltransferase
MFGVSPQTLDRLVAFERLLRQWQAAVNLVAPSTLQDIWHRHFADSAQLVALAPEARAWVDLGSGAGFPGLVVAILLAERGPTSALPSPPQRLAAGQARTVTLIESNSRKCAFMREVVRQTGIASNAPGGGGLVVDILSKRVPLAATQARLATNDVVSARALAPLHKLMTLAAPLFAPATMGVFPKGQDVETEIAVARRAWTFDVDLVQSVTDASGRIAVIRHLKPKTKE